MSEAQMAAAEPVDADVALPSDRVQAGRKPGEAAVLAVICAGGMIGATARYGAAVWWPTTAGHFPWTTLWVNVSGCALIGVLMVLVTDVFTGRRLIRPFLGTGVLGGFTTFSTYAVDIQRLVTTGQARTALGDLAVTVIAALVAVTTTTRLTRLMVAAARR